MGKYYGVMTEIYDDDSVKLSIIYGEGGKIPYDTVESYTGVTIYKDYYKTECLAKLALTKRKETFKTLEQEQETENKKEESMYIEKETLKGLLVNKDGVSFWVQKKWLKGASGNYNLTPAGWKSYHIAARESAKHFGFDALREFTFVRDTEKAVLMRCIVQQPDGKKTPVEFWLPKSMTDNFKFVKQKIQEIESGFPFTGTYVIWSGAETAKEGKR